ncbi:diphthamide biosynthesis protein 2 [Verruconis gallopava]|uniref:2-(3-amino-3-carboxypropyl)histidine synthase subunit 2 n=1 Tax=Verruconis gallopava TaxID=253628 RepID=A0A0D1ZY06_9PEZI|nr:diphthamide biosynthesis protein 2 [Verruconis gallopava]KIV99357.1 diphthamide biosynthesis protein 2 [Verruconis gallopava]
MATAAHLSTAPVLSTPDSHVFEVPVPTVDSSLPYLTDNELHVRYEIDRTIKEIRDGQWKRIALQFPDEMLGDGVRVYRLLKRGLAHARQQNFTEDQAPAAAAVQSEPIEQDVAKLNLSDKGSTHDSEGSSEELSILADTSYGSCCVDEIAAEHVEAEVVIHYGRSCLSPTARLPVIHVFTTRNLDFKLVAEAFKNTYPDKTGKVILMGDLPYHSHLSGLLEILRSEGYENILAPEVTHNPASMLPNRRLPASISDEVRFLKEHALFHIGQPPPALLLTLTSRVASIHIYSGDDDPTAHAAVTSPLLRRRYALLTSLSTASVFGILINTLSVKNYMHVVSHVQKLISAAGKKSYTFVVGKVNPAKVANFAEIGGWVVIGCWESSLIESRDFYKPLITPFELELALMSDRTRQWNGDWRSDFDTILGDELAASHTVQGKEGVEIVDREGDEDESAPPEYDLRTGRYVSHSRPMHATKGNARRPLDGDKTDSHEVSQSLMKRGNGELARIGGIISPGAEYLRSMKTWRGLGSDYEIHYDNTGAIVEEGQTGIAKGYIHESRNSS